MYEEVNSHQRVRYLCAETQGGTTRNWVDTGQVAKKLKRPQSHISNVETGQQQVEVVELQKFAEIYKKDIAYFLPK